MMHDSEKSDPGIVAEKRANKDATASAELVERRAGPEGKPGRRATCRAQKRVSVQQAAERIRAAAKRNPEERLVALLHHITAEALEAAYHALRQDAAAGVDGVTWAAYADGLADRLIDLHARVQRGAYRAPPSRRVYIPKEDGGQRPLGIAALEDKILQRAVTDTILVPIYETEFLGFSYGFRPGRGAHRALDAVTVGIERRKVSWVLDADIRGFLQLSSYCHPTDADRPNGPRSLHNSFLFSAFRHDSRNRPTAAAADLTHCNSPLRCMPTPRTGSHGSSPGA